MWIVDVEFRSKLKTSTARQLKRCEEKKKNTTTNKRLVGKGTTNSNMYVVRTHITYNRLRVRKTHRKKKEKPKILNFAKQLISINGRRCYGYGRFIGIHILCGAHRRAL